MPVKSCRALSSAETSAGVAPERFWAIQIRLDFGSIFELIFWSILDRPWRLQEPPKTAPRPPKTAPRPPKTAPRPSQDHPQRPRKRPKTTHRGPSTSQPTFNRKCRRTNQRKNTLILISRSENPRPPRSWMWWKNSKLCRFLSNRECSPCTQKQGSWGQVKSSLLLLTARYCHIEFSLTGQSSALLLFSTTTWFPSTKHFNWVPCRVTAIWYQVLIFKAWAKEFSKIQALLYW
mgnify:CR=1 FL=1